MSALATSDTLCAVAYWQRPVYSSGTEGTFEEMAPLFEVAADGGVDVLINGNDHIYERFAPRSGNGLPEPTGMRQFTVGTGGRSLDDFGRTDELSEFASNQSFGVLALELFNGSYGWDFLSVSGGGVDSGSAACH